MGRLPSRDDGFVLKQVTVFVCVGNMHISFNKITILPTHIQTLALSLIRTLILTLSVLTSVDGISKSFRTESITK